jgi:toxin-antitoxin system PIN domain toxin
LIAVDTNVLVYSVRADSPFHAAALKRVKQLAESTAPWAIPWPCIHEFLAIVTHPRIYRPPTPVKDALQQVEYWKESPSLRLLGEGAGAEAARYWEHLRTTLEVSEARGPRVHDARVAAIYRASGVREIWSADRDFSSMPGLLIRNPL